MKPSSEMSKLLSTFLLLAVLLTGLTSTGVRPAHAAAVHVVDLDAASLTQTDVLVTSSASDAKSFRVGAVVNASASNPISNLDGWQFTINYNATAFIPQGDPSAASTYPDGSANGVLFGAQTTTAAANWAGLIAGNKAFGSFTVNSFGSNGSITVFLTILAPNPTVTLSTNNILANVNFELLTKQSAPQLFRITNVIFVDSTGALIPGVLAGIGASETITNDPPRAMLIATPDTRSGPFNVVFEGKGSTDSDGTIANPAGYFWDFGDGTQDLGVTGALLNHNYTTAGSYNVTLRVADDLGATGSARDSLGNIIINAQPSHAFLRVNVGLTGDRAPIAIFTFTPADPTAGQPVSFEGSASFDPDGVITNWLWAFGDGSTTNGFVPTTSHSYSNPGNYTVILTVTDNVNLVNSTIGTIPVHPAVSGPALVAVNMSPSSPIIQNMTVASGSFTVNVEAVNAVNLFGWQFTLNYNNTAFQTFNASIVLGTFWQNALNTNTGFLSTRTISNGMITVAFTLLAGAPTVNGTSVLAAITLMPSQSGLYNLHLSNTLLADRAGQLIPSTTQDGFVLVPLVDENPVAQFSFTPANPLVGGQVFFDASPSSDPDGFINQFFWNFGDSSGSYSSNYPTMYHTYFASGNYTVTLSVIDSSGLSSTTSHVVNVLNRPPHDVAIVSIQAYPQIAVSSAFVGIQVVIANTGTLNDTVGVTIYANSAAVATLNGVFVQAPPPNCIGCSYYAYASVSWDTLGLAAGNYTISATVLLTGDPTPADNSMTDGTVTILPPPTLTVTPSSGSPGTKIIVHGSGFTGQSAGLQLGEIDVTFDDMFVGFTNTKNGSFNFTFDVPLSQPGPHLIKAMDRYFGGRASVDFRVTTAPASGGLATTVTVGSVYFPGDKVAIYVLATLNGAPVTSSSAQVTAIVINPNGTTTNLVLVAQTNGLYKATLSLSTDKALIGTYAVLAKAHMSGPLDAASVATFEVRLPWLSSGNGQATITSAAIVGIAGTLAVFWKKGYIKRRDNASALPF